MSDFEKFWKEYWTPTSPEVMNLAFKEVAEKAWIKATKGQAVLSNSTDGLCGDLNQGVGDKLEVVCVSGDSDGYGLPKSVMIRTETTGCVKKYIPEG